MEDFVYKALGLLKKSTGWTKDKDVKKLIEEQTKALKPKLGSSSEGKKGDATPYMKPFMTALDSTTVNCRIQALIQIGEIVQQGYYTGSEKSDKEDGKTEIEELMTQLCTSCLSLNEEAVSVQVLETIAAIISSGNCQIHEYTLLLALCQSFEIYFGLVKQESIDRGWQALSDIVGFVFERMNSEDIEHVKKHGNEDEQKQNKKDEKTKNTAGNAADLVSTLKTDFIPDIEIFMYPSVLKHLQYKYTLDTMRRGSVSEINNTGMALVNGDAEKDEDKELLDKLPTPFHRDAFAMLRLLGKFTLSPLDSKNGLQYRQTAFLLLEEQIVKAEDAINRVDIFIQCFRKYLLKSLLMNFLGQDTDVVRASLDFFIVVADKFKQKLMPEIEVFISSVFLPILNSDNSPYDHKMKTIQLFSKIVRDERSITEIFLNNDCVVDADSLFANIVKCLCQLAENRKEVDVAGAYTLEQDNDVRLSALENVIELIRPLAHNDTENSNTQTPREDGDKEGGENGEKDNDKDNNKQEDKQSASSITTPTPKEEEVSGAASEVLQGLSAKQQLQEDLKKAAAIFKDKPKKGLEYLFEKKRLKNTPEDVAQFLYKYCEEFDKTAIGDYLSGPDEFNGKVLHAYVELQDYTNVEFSEAIRLFLLRFRLPGEAQKIDRMMETFSARYTQNNPQAFGSADAAFVLAFSVIMLNTDLHNPNIPQEKKMNLDEFIRNNRGCNDGADFPVDMMTNIFNNILENPFTLKEDDALRAELGVAPPPKKAANVIKKKQEAFQIETNTLLRQTESALEQREEHGQERPRIYFDTVSASRAHVKPMMSETWEVFVDTFDKMLGSTEYSGVVDMCLEGTRFLITIGINYDIPEEFSKSMDLLSKYAEIKDVTDMEGVDKVRKSVNTLLGLVKPYGEKLGEKWFNVLKCTSQLAEFSLYASVRKDGTYFGSQNTAPQPKPKKKWFGRQSDAGLDIEECRRNYAQSLFEDFDITTIDAIYLDSYKLSGNAIVAFVKALTDVSLQELKSLENENDKSTTGNGSDNNNDAVTESKTFTMKKVLDVADANMNIRSRLEWSRIWNVMSGYFDTIACIQNQTVSLFSIDSLKQLSNKFLEKEELANFHFQKMFMKPFEVIVSKATDSFIKLLVIQVIENIVYSRDENLASGWSAVLSVLKIGAKDKDKEVIKTAYGLMKKVSKDYEVKVKLDNFVAYVNCLLGFASCKIPALRSKAFERLNVCGNLIERGRMLKTYQEGVTPLYTDAEEHTSILWPWLTGLGHLVNSEKEDIRKSSLEIMFGTLNNPKFQCTSELWRLLFKSVIFPIFDDVKYADEALLEQEDCWLHTSALVALNHVVDIFVNRFEKFVFLLPDLFDLFNYCVSQKVQSLATNGIAGVKRFVNAAGRFFDEKGWELVKDRIVQFYNENMPMELLDTSGLMKQKEKLEEIRKKLRTESQNKPEGNNEEVEDNADVSTKNTPKAESKPATTEEKDKKENGEESDEENVESDDEIEKRKKEEKENEIENERVKEIKKEKEEEIETRAESKSESIPTRGRLTIGSEVALLPAGSIVNVPYFMNGKVLEVREDNMVIVQFEYGLGYFPLNPTLLLSVEEEKELEEDEEFNTLPFVPARVVTKCLVQLELLKTTYDIISVYGEKLSKEVLDAFFKCLNESTKMAEKFNDNFLLRKHLGIAGLSKAMKMTKVPNLLKQETTGYNMILSSYIALICKEGVSKEIKEDSYNKYKATMIIILDNYLTKHRLLVESKQDMDSEVGREVMSYTGVIRNQILILEDLDDVEFKKTIRWIWSYLVKLIKCNFTEVREALSELFGKRLTDLVMDNL